MKKKIVAMICMLIALVTVMSVVTTGAKAADNSFHVGYARVDVNPYVIDGDFDSGIMQLPLRGSGDVWNRLSFDGLIDDNGDGRITKDDGLKATCIAVTDHTGKTAFLITIDLIGGGLLDKVAAEIQTRVEEALASGEIENVVFDKNMIYYGGTHTHNAPDATVYTAKGKVGTNNDGVDLSIVNENLGIWIERTIEDVGDAAIIALKDRAPAKLVKDEIAASEANAAVVKGKTMNSVRHYNNLDSNGNVVCVAGDNFNTRGSNPQPVTDVNDVMYLLQFDFTEHNKNSSDKKLNIVLANWRGHPSMNNNNDYYGSRNCISSDYVNSFRHALEYTCAVSSNGAGTYSNVRTYRVAFFNGAGGNVNPRGRAKVNGVWAYQWIDDMSKGLKVPRGTVYGRVLATMAYEGLMTTGHREDVTYSEIRATHYTYNSVRKTTNITALGYEAGKAFQAEYAVNTGVKLPYVYPKNASANEEVFVIGSRFHANSVVSNWDTTTQQPKDDVVSLELSAFMLGENLAFVVIPGEPFDYYYNEDGTNAWLNLVSDVYGTPFVLGYTNGANGYIPNSKAYDYNLGSRQWMRGSYESSITPYAQGTGEKMINLFEKMLGMMVAGEDMSREAMCVHCGEVVRWDAYKGESVLDTGHYYMIDDSQSAQVHINPKANVCFDLNGYTLSGDTRAIYTTSGGGATINIMDTSAGQTGKLMGRGSKFGITTGFNGASMIIDSGNTCNFYSGTITVNKEGVRSVAAGGVIRNKGTFNMYGGVITGAVGYNFTGKYLKSGTPTEFTREGKGAAIHNAGKVNIYGGRIDNGDFYLITGQVTGNKTDGYKYSQTLTPCEGIGTAIYSESYVKVAGDAVVGDVYFASSSAKLFSIDTSETPFTGSVQLTFAKTLDENADIGNCTAGTVLPEGALTFADGELKAVVKDGNIYAHAGAAIIFTSGEFTYYSTFEKAVAAYSYSAQDPSFIRLLEDVDGDIMMTQNTYLDLNGYNVNGSAAAAMGKTLYCMDSKTDDYTVADGIYGKITGSVSANVVAVSENSVGAMRDSYNFGYIRVIDADGTSFHRVGSYVSKISLRPSEAGIYYTGNFCGDALVTGRVEEYGIALNAFEEPNKDNIKANGSSICVVATEAWESERSMTGAMLSGIMKQSNSATVNAENADIVIYGRAYIKIDGGYIFSDTVQFSLKQLVEFADEYNLINGDGLTSMAQMYELYAEIMDKWNLPRLRIQMAQMD